MSVNENPRVVSGNGEDNVGIPDDRRCKRSDGKQWRCTAMSMPDKTVCEKHYIQAKRRAANSAWRASLKRAKRKSFDESDAYAEGNVDNFETTLTGMKVGDYSNGSVSRKNSAKEKSYKSQMGYSSEAPGTRNFSTRFVKSNDESLRDAGQYEETWRPYRTPPIAAIDSSLNRSQQSFSPMDYSGASTDASAETLEQTCHQCQRKDEEGIICCLKCNRRAFCSTCISTWYSEFSPGEIEKACPSCRGLCNCKSCLRSDNAIKVQIREIPILDRLQHLYRLLSAVLPVIKQIHREQCSEVELEKKLRGTEIDLVRARLKADEQMCCNVCRIPVVDYYRHCSSCSYDLCLRCCQDLRAESSVEVIGTAQDIAGKAGVPKLRLRFSDKFPKWKANSNGGIPCPPKEYGGCGSQSLNLGRIFKMNWVAKLVKNTEEMVSGCKVSSYAGELQDSDPSDSGFCKLAHREDSSDNFVYSPSLDVIKSEGVISFEKQWTEGRPVIIKRVLDETSLRNWDPEVIWRDIKEISDEKTKDQDPLVKAVDCLNGSEVDIRLGEFMKAYAEGRTRENSLPQLLKLKEWPSPSASEELLFYQRPEFISRLPLLEYIHPRLGLLNVAAKLPHYSLQSDAGPKIHVACGTYEELGSGDSVTYLHYNMRDMVYLLVHTSEGTLKGSTEMKPETEKPEEETEEGDALQSTEAELEDGKLPDLSLDRPKAEQNDSETRPVVDSVDGTDHHNEESSCVTSAGARWDIFRRQDVPKLVEYLQTHCRMSQKPDYLIDDFASRPLYEGMFLNEEHKRKLKEEHGIEPWSFEQHPGEVIFVPTGCPFQVRNLRSNVQLLLDFLFPESVGEAVRLAEEIRCLPNDHEAKIQTLEIGKISLYAASSAIKEVQKLVLDPKLGAELGFEDPNLTKAVSENLEKAVKRPHISCV
ncbi:PREDICTED: lysine-specific demethylase JMJ25 [Tarenaya hassleriana]|uniref:lysine-specific demethylase JMJ25 n=1 Tax=Tarenaya hassleriana TaxID=28532 RepID=UPI00053C4F84|nr:PREDICTED: lysine-specific demethylase JMJ25 [Tarenaya hassleriana]